MWVGDSLALHFRCSGVSPSLYSYFTLSGKCGFHRYLGWNLARKEQGTCTSIDRNKRQQRQAKPAIAAPQAWLRARAHYVLFGLTQSRIIFCVSRQANTPVSRSCIKRILWALIGARCESWNIAVVSHFAPVFTKRSKGYNCLVDSTIDCRASLTFFFFFFFRSQPITSWSRTVYNHCSSFFFFSIPQCNSNRHVHIRPA